MVISHQYKYLFVELPRTGTTAVSHELRKMYKGKLILRKHSSYQEFLRVATEDEKRYFVFTCVRNPLDDAVSHYYKLKTNHRSVFSSKQTAKNGTRLADMMDAFLYQYIHKKNMDFPTFFRKFHWIPYNNWASRSIDKYDYIMRFESLQEDFARVLKMIEIEPVRPLPYLNVTAERRKEYWMYYSPDIIPRAKRIYGPYMRLWGYDFPVEWGECEIPWWNQLEFDFFNQFRKLYWNFLRPKI